MSQPPVRNTSNTTDVLNGKGPSTSAAASESTPTRATKSPVIRFLCQIEGWVMICRTSNIVSDSTVRQLLMPAKLRRTTTPKALDKPIPITIAAPVR